MSTNPDKTAASRGHRLVKLVLDLLNTNPEYANANDSEDKGSKSIVTNSRHAKTLAKRAIEETVEEASDVSCDDGDSYKPHDTSDTDEHSLPDAQSFRTALTPRPSTTGNCSISTTRNGKTHATSPQPSASKNGNNRPAPPPPTNGRTHSATPQHSPAKKRRISDPSKWKRNAQRMKRLKGEEYLTTIGKPVSARPTKVPRCLNRPKHKCCTTFTQEKRELIYKEFHELQTLDQQRQFVLKHVTISRTKRKTVGCNSRRKSTKVYSLTCEGENKIVCREFFLDTLIITEGLVRGAFNKLSPSGFLQADKRGRKTPPQKLTNDDDQFIRVHILSFPAVESHYCRKASEYKYLDSSLNVATMYSLYKSKCNEAGKTPVGAEKYRQMFREYKISFHKPKKDLCKRCEAHKEMVSGSNQDYDETPYLKHLERKEAAREHRNEDMNAAKNDSKVLAFNFDLQAVLNTPKGAAGPFFYVRKLAIYNLTLYNLGNQDVQCFTWDETEGKRGSIEISTCIYKYLMTQTGIQHVRMMSDSCAEQQKNSTFACMCLHVVRNHPTIQLIDHGFFEPGHSQMECDSIHSKIEQKAKAIPVYTPDGWVQIMRTARTKPRPYEVTVLHEDFQDFNSTKEQLRSRNSPISQTPEKFRDAVWLQYRKEKPDTVFMKTDYAADSFREMIFVRKMGHPRLQNVQHPYSSRFNITASKKRDLMKLCHDLLIPRCYHDFYANLPSSSDAHEVLPAPDAFEDSESDE